MARRVGDRRTPLGDRRSLRSGAAERRGTVLVLFAVLLFGVFGLFAVVLDFGIVRLTQIQMQTSADVAALEGLVGRDADLSDPGAADLARRQQAALAAALVFDEDGDPTTGPSRFRLGAGPLLRTGVDAPTDFAGGLIVEEGQWIPALQTNVDDNLVSGDLVAGSFLQLDPGNPGRPDWHQEANDYTRLDFAPDAAGGAFLARLRRTREGQPLDRVAGVSSAGPTLPLLFGYASALRSNEPGDYDLRRDGFTVRATAIADSRRVTAAGIATATTRGLAPLEDDTAPGASRWLSLNASDWDLVPVGSTLTLAVDGAGSVVDAGSGLPVGFAAQRDPAVNTINGSAPIGRLGSFLLPQANIVLPASPPAGLTGQVYATVHETDPSTGRFRVLGVVPVRIDGVAAGATLQVTCTKLDALIASSNGARSSNATAQPSAADDLAYVDQALVDRPRLFPVLRAPVLAR